jgi:hypothetical protein
VAGENRWLESIISEKFKKFLAQGLEELGQ